MSDDREISDLRWQAFRYVAGEMNADEALALEAQLADDQQAREAVSWAVSLGVQVAAARPMVQSQEVASRRKASLVAIGGWIAAAASLTLLVWSYFNTTRETAPLQQSLANSAPQEASIDAVAWLELQHLNESTRQSERDFEESAGGDNWELPADRDSPIPSWVVGLSGGKEGASNHE